MVLTKTRDDRLQPSVRFRSEDVPVASESDAECFLVITTCYEAYLQMYAMLAAFAELRGDDPRDALGSPPEELWGTSDIRAII